MADWQPISDPPPDGPVLIFVQDATGEWMTVAQWIQHEDDYSGWYALPVIGAPITGVTHWMALPEPPSD